MPSQKGAHELPLRIEVTNPLPGVALVLQSGKDGSVPPTATSSAKVTFDFTVRVDLPDDDGTPTFYGPFTQGPPHGRFVYICVGKRAGQYASPWDRRAKIPLGGITATQVREALAIGGRLALAYPGVGRDGGPTCATVKLPGDAWRVVG
ncbi:MAG: hypothetical protein KC544_11510 [Gemmatimonadetes bacterium]|nr:hypothetical protein [Gemmatimonadota bacterium]MCA9763744.1 hypothetical protein [Gemmatimonadota bacterium]MCB9518468.1 hypothetical protein [Gemmatimonadales bacterium]HPF61358.1 DUF5990 family protein [Gemmatimonadales bacterium]HRX19848.1 DUF5990 family protein [Gemmatimonadales bacterium]